MKTEMNTEMNVNEPEQVNGGNIFEDVVKYVKERVEEVIEKIKPAPVIAGK